MVYFRKRLTPEVLGEINEMILRDAKERQEKEVEQGRNDDDSAPPSGGVNSGTLIVDATCAPTNIRFPQDVSLLDEARENAEQIIDTLQEQSIEKKPRTYRNKAHKNTLKYMRSRKHTEKMLDMFLEKGAITQAQHDKSLGDLIEKMGMTEIHPLN